jgi:hypothetical protein
LEHVVHALSLPTVTTHVLILAFGTVGITQFVGIDVVRRAYLRWGYPARIFRLTGGVELLAAILLATSSAHFVGVVLAAGVNFIAVALLLNNREYLLALPGIAVMAALPLTLIPTH